MNFWSFLSFWFYFHHSISYRLNSLNQNQNHSNNAVNSFFGNFDLTSNYRDQRFSLNLNRYIFKFFNFSVWSKNENLLNWLNSDNYQIYLHWCWDCQVLKSFWIKFSANLMCFAWTYSVHLFVLLINDGIYHLHVLEIQAIPASLMLSIGFLSYIFYFCYQTKICFHSICIFVKDNFFPYLYLNIL